MFFWLFDEYFWKRSSIQVLKPTTFYTKVNSIPMLKESNFSEWKENLLRVLALLDIDISLREERPDPFTHTEATKRWNRSNNLSMMIMELRIPEESRGFVPKHVRTARGYLAVVEKWYVKREISSKTPIIMKMRVADKLKRLGMHINDHVSAERVIRSLPSEFNQFKYLRAYMVE